MDKKQEENFVKFSLGRAWAMHPQSTRKTGAAHHHFTENENHSSEAGAPLSWRTLIGIFTQFLAFSLFKPF